MTEEPIRRRFFIGAPAPARELGPDIALTVTIPRQQPPRQTSAPPRAMWVGVTMPGAFYLAVEQLNDGSLAPWDEVTDGPTSNELKITVLAYGGASVAFRAVGFVASVHDRWQCGFGPNDGALQWQPPEATSWRGLSITTRASDALGATYVAITGSVESSDMPLRLGVKAIIGGAEYGPLLATVVA